MQSQLRESRPEGIVAMPALIKEYSALQAASRVDTPQTNRGYGDVRSRLRGNVANALKTVDGVTCTKAEHEGNSVEAAVSDDASADDLTATS